MKFKKIIVSLLFLSMWSAGLEARPFLGAAEDTIFKYESGLFEDVEPTEKTIVDRLKDQRNLHYDLLAAVATISILGFYLHNRYNAKNNKAQDKDNKQNTDNKKDEEDKQDSDQKDNQ